jgi:DNA-binding IclR family transcriptional regulator
MAPKRSNPRIEHDERGDTGIVRTVLVAAKVLDALGSMRGPVRLADLARSLKMTLPRISRHVATLRSLELIEKAEPMEAYRLGMKLFVLGQIALEQNGLAQVCEPHLARLRDQVHRTVILSTRSGDEGAVLMCVPSHESPTIIVRPGMRLELPASPSARILYTFRDDTVEARPKSADLYLEERINFVLANYFDYEPDPRGTGIGSIAAPVFDHDDRLVGVVAVVMPTTVLAGGPDSVIVKAVTECAARISSAIGSSAWDRRISLPPKRVAHPGRAG